MDGGHARHHGCATQAEARKVVGLPSDEPTAASRPSAPGIAVVTYRRRDRLVTLIGELLRLTHKPFQLVVADDGGDDGTVQWCLSKGIRVVTGANRGVAWNKNRGLFALSLLECDPLILMEDDVHPVVSGWQDEWIAATRRWEHVGFLHPKIAPHTLSGTGGADAPFINPKATAQCLSVSAAVLAKVGFLDSRFTGWGHEHAEWTIRIKRLGYGFTPVDSAEGHPVHGLLYISGGLAAQDAPSHRDNDQVRANLATYRQIVGEPPFRYPWRSNGERDAFLAEQRAAGLPLSDDRASPRLFACDRAGSGLAPKSMRSSAT
jgi:hypothetical protein